MNDNNDVLKNIIGQINVDQQRRMNEYLESDYTDAEYMEREFNALNEAKRDEEPIKNLSKMSNFNQIVQPKVEKKKKVTKIAKLFSSLSRLGMSYDEDLIKRMTALPGDKALLDADMKQRHGTLYDRLRSGYKQKSNKDLDFNEKSFPERREILRKLAIQPELEDILDVMTNECIVYESNNTYFCHPYIDSIELKKFDKLIQKKITDSVNRTFNRLYKQLRWNKRAWDDFKRFLIEGHLAWEIIYDSKEPNKTKNILALIPLDPATLTRKISNEKIYWVQFAGVQNEERQLLDSQIVYIQYQDTESIERTSYLERLIRPYNVYRIIEQAQVVWTINNAQPKMLFRIPVQNMSKQLAKQTLATTMQDYKEDVQFNIETGELKVNGKPNFIGNKEYWMPSGDAGTPEIEMIDSTGPELNDNDQLSYFRKQMYRISKIPLSRFDQESGDTWFGADATSVARTEIDFSKFVTRLRNLFSEVLLKPILIQLIIDVPELMDDSEFLNSIQIRYESYNVFEELMEMELMQKRVDFMQSMKDSLVDMSANGNDVKFWSNEYLVRKYLKLSDADMKLNARLRQQELDELNDQSDEEAEALNGEGGEDDSPDF